MQVEEGKSFRKGEPFLIWSPLRGLKKSSLPRTNGVLFEFPGRLCKYKAELAAIDSSDEESESEGEGSSGASARSKAIASIPPDSSDEEEEGDEEEGQQDKGGEEEEVIGRGQRIVMAV